VTARPMLRDAVDRRQRFEAAHPEVTITVPGTASGWWIAAISAGSVPADPERTKVTAWQLADLMDALERIWPPGEPDTELRADRGARSRP
jgi:hypothetical protein